MNHAHNKTAAAFAFLLLASLALVNVAVADDSLEVVLDAQDEDVQARYVYRHPQETLEFFGVEPGMVVVEGFPGGGWYSKILIQYLGEDGQLIGANYDYEMFPLFGFFSPEQLDKWKTWENDWPQEAQTWGGEDGAAVAAFSLGSMPNALGGTADVVLMVRAFHNLARFEDQGGYLTDALEDIYNVLKPGGILGVVQHEAPADSPDDWADGNAGYLKKAWLIARIEDAGFEFVGESDVNENPADQPTTEEIVWRLPPNYATSRNNPELKAEMDAIGESNRMTLKFRKP